VHTNEASRVHSLRVDSFLEGVVEKKLVNKKAKNKASYELYPCIHAFMHPHRITSFA